MCPKVLYIQYNESDAGSGGKHSSHCRHKNNSHVAFYIRICFSRRMLALGTLLTLYSFVSLLPRDAELPPGQSLREQFHERQTFHPLLKPLLLSGWGTRLSQYISDYMGLFFLFLHLGSWMSVYCIIDCSSIRKLDNGQQQHYIQLFTFITSTRIESYCSSVSLLLRFPGT